jgi:hypothetical protein
MTKHVAKNATVDATEVTAKNIDALAEKHGATVMDSQRTEGLRFLLVEGPEGTTRADVGGFLVEDGDGNLRAFQTADAFYAVYERP